MHICCGSKGADASCRAHLRLRWSLTWRLVKHTLHQYPGPIRLSCRVLLAELVQQGLKGQAQLSS